MTTPSSTRSRVDASAFVDPTKTNNLTAGKAPHIYVLEPKGIEYLVEFKFAQPGELHPSSKYNATNSHHVAHLIEIRNFRV